MIFSSKILNLTILFLSFGCRAQNPIINIKDQGDVIDGVYYKDIDSLLNTYEGTWLYTNAANNSSLKIILAKKTMQYDGRCYEDLIIGEYEYKVNGTTIISTLSDLNTPFQYQSKHHLFGNTLLKKTSRPICNDCGIDERRLEVNLTDPTTRTFGTLMARKMVQNGQDILKIFIRSTGPGIYLQGTTPPAPFKVPEGEYILVKQ